MSFKTILAIIPALFCHLLMPVSAQAWDLSSYFQANPLPECKIFIDRSHGNRSDETRITVRAQCEKEQARNIKITVSDGKKLKTVKECPTKIVLTTYSDNVVCSFPWSHFESIRVHAQIQMDQSVITRDEFYRKDPTYEALPKIRILKGGRSVTPIDLRVLVEDMDLDYFSGEYSAVEAILKTPHGDQVLMTTSVYGDLKEARFKWDELKIPAGDYQIFFRAYDAYGPSDYTQGEYVDSEVVTVSIQELGS